MSAPSFGFSTNEVVLLVQLTGKVIHALKDGGAKSEYQKATRDLESLQAVLETMNNFFNDPTFSPSIRNAIQAQFAVAARSIALFNKKLQHKYGDSLNSVSTSAPHRKAMKKVEWTFRVADDLAKFRVELWQQLEPARFLGMLFHVQSSAKATSTASESKNILLANTTLYQNLADRNRDVIQNRFDTLIERQDTASEQQTKALESLEKTNKGLHDLILE